MKIKTRSFGIVILRYTHHSWHFLILRCFRNWDFPKGMNESGETPMQTALREVQEETTISQLTFPWGDIFRETQPYAQGKVARYYLATTQQTDISLPVNPELGQPEHHEFRWVSYEEARLILPHRLQPVLEWAHEQITSYPEKALDVPNARRTE